MPLKTSLYVELGMSPDARGDKILADSVSIRLEPRGGEPVELLGPDGRFAEGASGWLRPRQVTQGLDSRAVDQLSIYVDPDRPLRPTTAYTVRVSARSRDGAELPEAAGTWCFTTESAPGVHTLDVSLDLAAEPVHWQGAFFSGFGNVQFCTQRESYGPTYDLMAEARRQHPRAWSYQRDFWMTGTEFRPPGFFPSSLPNVVRERETRRITAIEEHPDGASLRVEDFFGHEQYGIASGRPVSEDYHPGDEVLIADGVHDARVEVRSVDDGAGTVQVGPVATPEGGWKIAYERPLPEKEDPDAPGLFPPGGCYLRKFNPVGTPCYYWGRLDKEWDLAAPPLWPPAPAELRRRHRRPRPRRPELDHRQGPRPVARGRPSHRRAHHRPLRRRFPGLHLEHLQRARPRRPVLAGRLGRAPALLRLHRRRDPAGLRGPRP